MNPLELDWTFEGDETDEDELESEEEFEDKMAKNLCEDKQEEL